MEVLYNAITNHFFFEKEGMIPFHFDEEANLIYEPTQVKYTPKIRKGEDNYVEKDYALILNVRNPLCEGKRILAIIGCRSIGCYGGAVFLARRMAGIKREIKDEEYAVVVECEGEEDNIIDQPKYISYYPLNYAEVYTKVNHEINEKEYEGSPQIIDIQF